MAKLKSLEQMAKEVGPGDLIRLTLQARPMVDERAKENTVVVGYRWDRGWFYSGSGMGANQDDTYKEILKRGVDISKGYYLGAVILGYEVVERCKQKKQE